MSEIQKRDTPEQAEFRAYCREWLEHNNPPLPLVRMPMVAIEIMHQDQMMYLQAWQKSAYDAGLVGCDYPIEFGGGGRQQCQSIANQEMKRAKTPILPNSIGLGMVAPTLFYHASDELKHELMPSLFSGADIWCQGFSEPGAGSDLACVSTSAVRKGDKWIINGHKVWTSLAQFSSWMILLARTDKQDKYKGLSYFVVPIKSALGNGVTVRPLVKMTGESGFNEVLFEDFEIDDGYRLDKIGAGWQVAMTTLAHERGAGKFVTPESGGQARVGEVQDPNAPRGPYRLLELAKQISLNGRPVIEDAVFRDRIMQCIIRYNALRQNLRRNRVQALNDSGERITLQTKLVGTELAQDVAQLALEIQGLSSSLYLADENAPDSGHWPLEYMNSFGGTIAAGTSEVQRNILGERVLGLAKTK